MTARDANRRLAWRLLAGAVGMFFFGFALVPLYDVFCEVTGLNGKTSGPVSEAVAGAGRVDRGRWVTLQLVGNVNAGIDWAFGPETASLRVHPGEAVVVAYTVHNRSGRPVVGQAVPSVTPGLAARYIEKIECFCFTRQPLGPEETKTMPVRLVIDPALPDEVRTLTLSYTFFEADSG
jgi:cytochrome c oxidase assembly protein subunit 11